MGNGAVSYREDMSRQSRNRSPFFFRQHGTSPGRTVGQYAKRNAQQQQWVGMQRSNNTAIE
jgi:hypothetical protein